MENIRKSREVAGLSQFAVAKRTGIPRMRLSLAECGEIELRANELNLVRKILREEIERRASTLQTALSAFTPEEVHA
jgi:transcriptional regulator with XRE-family HTH domain